MVIEIYYVKLKPCQRLKICFGEFDEVVFRLGFGCRLKEWNVQQYVLCENVEEVDSKHVLFNCPSRQHVWSMFVFC
jgi:hypothetical protein